VKAEATEGVALISERSWSRTARHSTCTAEIEGVLNSSARSAECPVMSNRADANVGATRRKKRRPTALVLNRPQRMPGDA
jgi:hypothetical protein